MSACRYIIKSLILAFFDLNGINKLKDLESATTKFKKDYSAFEETVNKRFNLNFPSYFKGTKVSVYASKIIKYSSIAQIVLSVIGVWCGFSSAFVGLIYFIFEMIHLNIAKINFKSSVDVEKYALPFSLFLMLMATGCCRAGRGKCNKSDKSIKDSILQSSTKKRH